jgi:hypothetical protein
MPIIIISLRLQQLNNLEMLRDGRIEAEDANRAAELTGLD